MPLFEVDVEHVTRSMMLIRADTREQATEDAENAAKGWTAYIKGEILDDPRTYETKIDCVRELIPEA